MPLVKKVAVAAGALTLAATGIAAAAPDDADKGLTIAEEQTGEDLPVAGAHGPETDLEEPEVEDGADVEIDDRDAAGDGEHGDGKPMDNHGAIVSAVAQTELGTGREHGAAVSEVARQNGGAAAAGPDVEGAVDVEDAVDVGGVAAGSSAASNRAASAGGKS